MKSQQLMLETVRRVRPCPPKNDSTQAKTLALSYSNIVTISIVAITPPRPSPSLCQEKAFQV